MRARTPGVKPAAALARTLLAHYDRHRRPLPWRATRDPWAIWVSEVMLQQTRVDTVRPYYARFLARFPTVSALATADEAEVLAQWSGLGYYRRARLLHAGAQAVVREHGGVVPADPAALGALPGVGRYTLGAIGSIAFGRHLPVLDGNVERVLCRVHAVAGAPRAPANRRRLWALAQDLADQDRPGDVNQALMELGATVCAPRAPRCDACPWADACVAHARGEERSYPAPTARMTPREERWCALVAHDVDGRAWLVPSAGDRWRGMLLPPLATDPGHAGARGVARALGVAGDVVRLREIGTLVHVLTHARMTVRVFTAALRGAPARGTLVMPADLDALPVPRIARRLLALAEATSPGRSAR